MTQKYDFILIFNGCVHSGLVLHGTLGQQELGNKMSQWQTFWLLLLLNLLTILSNWKENMKKFIILSLLVLFTSSAYAGSCPMIAKNLDSKIEEAKEMRDAGMKAHKAGDHAKSEELLNKAMTLFKS